MWKLLICDPRFLLIYFPFRYAFTPTKEEKEQIVQRFDNNLTVPKNFVRTAPAYDKATPKKKSKNFSAVQNPQTVQFCETLAVDDPLQLIAEHTGLPLSLSMEESFSNTTFIDDTFEDDPVALQASPVKKLGNLSLPQPKQDSSVVELESSENCEEILDMSFKIESEVQTDSQTENDGEDGSGLKSESESQSVESNGEDNNEIGVKENDDKTADLPMPKKLKRRNENLYKTE